MTAPTPGHTPAPTPSGVLLIDKAPGYTSMDVCAIVRTRLRRSGAPKRLKVGHAGTLDPAATGLLVVLVGPATRRCDEFMASEKAYDAVVDLAHRSNSDDADGLVTEAAAATPPEIDAVRALLPRFTGEILQRPPAFSALHVGGRRAYELAREGRLIELPPRPVVVHSLEILAYDWPHLTLRVTCGKGTYIRSLARDLGQALGVGGMLRGLRRTRSGSFTVDQAKRLDQLPDVITQECLISIPPPQSRG